MYSNLVDMHDGLGANPNPALIMNRSLLPEIATTQRDGRACGGPYSGS